MSSCAGPYTRVFFDAADAAAIQGLADGLAARGLRAVRLGLPRGRGGIDDLSCDMAFEGGTVVRVAKFLGPKKILRQTHVYEIVLQTSDDGPQGGPKREGGGSLFDARLKPLIARFLGGLADLMAGRAVAGLTAGADAHDTRIALCNDL